nr:hypothetical protein [Tanacetum cinerariifolium]
MVKDFKLYVYNPGMETRIWSEDDRRSKDFMEIKGSINMMWGIKCSKVFLLLEYIPTVSISVPTTGVYTAKKFATVEDFVLLHEDKIYSESKMHYLQHEHYALWEVIEFGDSYKAPPEKTTKDKGLAGKVSSSTKKKGRTVAVTVEDMQKRKNDVKARTTLLLDLPDEYQLRFSKYNSTKELLQAIVSHLEFMDVPIEKDDLNQKFLTSLAPEWLVYTIVWRNRDDLDTMSLDDVYNHLKVYETKIYDDDIEEMDIKWNLDLLSMRADRFWKKTAIDGIGWDWSYMAEEDKALKNHALVADDEEVPTEYALMAKSSSSSDNK